MDSLQAERDAGGNERELNTLMEQIAPQTLRVRMKFINCLAKYILTRYSIQSIGPLQATTPRWKASGDLD
jgi:hypothetical protein